MSRHNSKNLVRGAILLSLAGFIAKGLGASYRVILQNLIGDEAVYVYQQVYPFLAFALMLSLYGYPSAIAALTRDNTKIQQNFIRSVFLIIFGLSSLIGLTLYLLAPSISEWVGDMALVPNYRLAALVFCMIPFAAILRGLYQGKLHMSPIASSQVVEQFVRVGIIIGGAWLIYQQVFNVYTIGQIAVIASLIGGLGAILTLLLFRRQLVIDYQTNIQIPRRAYIGTIVVLGLASTLNHSVLVLMQIVDSLIFLPQLLKSGYTFTQAVLEKGIYDRGQPLIQIGSVVGSSFALAVLPFVSMKKLKESGAELEAQIHTSMKCSLMLSLGATIGLIGLFPHVNQMLFTDTLGTDVLQILMFSILFSSLLMAGIAILQGLHLVKHTALYILIGVLCKVLFNILLIPLWGSFGAAIGTIMSLVVIVFIVLHRVRQLLPSGYLFGGHTVWQSVLRGIAFLVVFTYVFRQFGFWLNFESRFLLFVYIIAVSLTGAVGYLWILIRKNLFTAEEIKNLPFRSVLEKIPMRVNK